MRLFKRRKKAGLSQLAALFQLCMSKMKVNPPSPSGVLLKI